MVRWGVQAAFTLHLLCMFAGVGVAQELRPEYRALGDLGPGAVLSGPGRADGRILYQAFDGNAGEAELRLFDRSTGVWSRWSGLPGADVAWSRDGDWVAMARPDEAGRELYVWVQPTAPGTARPTGPARRVGLRPGRGPAFSPDGRWLAYTALPATDTAAARIVVIPVTGGEERVLVRAPGFAQQLEWSPDGRWIYYRYAEAGPPPRRRYLVRVPTAGGGVERIAPIREFIGLSRDGRYLAYHAGSGSGQSDSVVILAIGGQAVGWMRPRPGLSVVAWSATAATLVASRTTTPSSVRLVPLTGGNPRDVPIDAPSENPSWSPDGRRIALQVLDDGRRYHAVVEPGRGRMRRFVGGEDPDPGTVLWAPDGSHFAFSSGGLRHLDVLELERGERRRLVSAEALTAAAWRPDGRSLVYGRRDADRHAVHEVTLDGRDRRLLDLSGRVPDDARIRLVGDTLVLASSRAGVWLVDTRTTRVRPLDMPGTGDRGPHYTPSDPVSKDGRWAVVVSASEDDRGGLHFVPLSGGPARVLAVPGLEYEPLWIQWHPDGRHLLVAGQARLADRPDVYLLPLNGEPPRVLTESDGGLWLGLFDLAPDGSMLAYTSVGTGSTELWEIDLSRALGPAPTSHRPFP